MWPATRPETNPLRRRSVTLDLDQCKVLRRIRRGVTFVTWSEFEPNKLRNFSAHREHLMAATDAFRKQHAEIGALVESLKSALASRKIVDESDKVRTILSSLFGKLSVHLAMEDNSLYPRLEKHEDPKLREVAHRFAREMA